MISARLSVDLVRPEDAEQVVRLNHEFRLVALTNEEEFHWRLSKNPAGPPIVPVIRDEAGRVVGIIWVVPIRAKVDGRVVRMAQSMDLIIHPKYRDSFAYPLLRRRFERVFGDEGIAMHMAFFSRIRYQQMLREPLERHAMTTFAALIRPLNLPSACQEFPGRPWKKALARVVGPLVCPFYFRRHRYHATLVVSECAGFGPEFDEFWSRVEGRFQNVVIRDSAYMSWRFPNLAERRYRVLVARDAGGVMHGYAVIRDGNLNGISTGLIMDLLVTEGDQGMAAGCSLVSAAETSFRESGQSLSATLVAPGSAEGDVLASLGYRSLPRFLQQRSFAFGTVLHPEVEGCPESSDPERWFVTFADRERN